MTDRVVTLGFAGRPRAGGAKDRVPPGQPLVRGFPALSAGPTPNVVLRRFTHAPGVVLRCPAFDGAQLAIAKTPGGYRFDIRVRTAHPLRMRRDGP